MKTVVLGSTKIQSGKNAFGALPIQRVDKETAARLLKKAYAAGFTFFDTAIGYSDSEEKIGYALSDVRDKIHIATKTMAKNGEDLWKNLETSLSRLQTSYIDIYQFHNPPFCPKPNDGTGLYEAALKAKAQGLIKHIGITNHSLKIAHEAIDSGLYETLQFPFNYLASDTDIELVDKCAKHDMGFLCMKALSGGLITNAKAAYAWLDQYDHALPIWGIQRERELNEFISFMDNPPTLNDKIRETIDWDRQQLAGDFCRACGYCMPTCPAQIEISTAARMAQLIRRSPSSNWLGERGQKLMEKTKECIECGVCKSHCPYGLDTPALLKKNYEDYQNILAGKVKI
ncbi:MAG: aldo/keto reductase [Erysipelotrichaceae bacterium]|jgi:predicted aldo/keto reductase-like oxidoreductase|nr:aldo/keto reductase [Erysipelotrichaceae bacterium]